MAPEEALRAPPSALLGVTPDAEAALAALEIRSIFDLAASRVFAVAAELLALEHDPTAAAVRLNTVAGDVAQAPSGVPVQELAQQPIAILRGVGEAAAPELAAALDVETVRDLTLWPPYSAAKAILAAAFFPEQAVEFDGEAPADLLPTSGVYPTERVFFRKLVIDAVPEPGDGAEALEHVGHLDHHAGRPGLRPGDRAAGPGRVRRRIDHQYRGDERSSSFGARELAAGYAQDINDRSQQNASSVRNRRASIVREVSQAEHEQISTRVLTNYNHMHALSVQYFEVVQAFRATTQLERAERCLFVPVKLVDFTDPALVDRWRLRLATAALTERARRQLTVEYGVVEVIPQTPRITPGKIIVAGDFHIDTSGGLATKLAGFSATPAAVRFTAADGSGAPAAPPAPEPSPPPSGSPPSAPPPPADDASSSPSAPPPSAPPPPAVDYRRAPINAPAALLDRLVWLERFGDPSELLEGLPPGKLADLAAEACVLDAAELKDHTLPKRSTLLLCPIARRQVTCRDDLAATFGKRIAKFHARAREELERIRAA